MDQPILLCADDYGQTAAISAGILRLAEKRRINAISCMVNTDAWLTAALSLKSVQETCYIGLHLNLTWGHPLSKAWRHVYSPLFPRLPRLLRWCYTGLIDHRVICLEIEAQISAFYRHTGRLPDFIDGHEHVHQFLRIREALLHVREESGLKSFLRSTINTSNQNAWVGFPKSQCIAGLGGRKFKRLLMSRGIPTNTSFAGIYHFTKVQQYPAYFKEFLMSMVPGGLIMCHPGLASEDKQDPIGLSRPHEYQYFLSDLFLEDLKQAKCILMEKKESLHLPLRQRSGESNINH